MIELNDKTFDPTLKVTTPMLVMFYARWAGPALIVVPSYEAAAQKFGNQIVFTKFDLDDNPRIPARYNVRHVPLFVRFDNGVMTDMKAGAISPETIMEMCHER